MSTPTNQQTSDEPISSPNTGGVRRHHTISAASRGARLGAREAISEEAQQQAQEIWNEDEVVGDDWVGGVGAVGEKSGLHRQSSLPTRYHRAFQSGTGSKTGTHTPKTLNSLTAITGHEGDEEEWEREIGGYSVHDDERAPAPTEDYQAAPAASGVRRHVSLTYGAQGGQKHAAGLKRSGTLQATLPPHPPKEPLVKESDGPSDDYGYVDEQQQPIYDEEVYSPQGGPGQYGPGPVNLVASSPWTLSAGESDWRTPGGAGLPVDEVSRALSALELADNRGMGAGPGQGQQHMYANYSQPAPRFNAGPTQLAAPRHSNNNGHSNGQKSQDLPDFDGRKTPLSQQAQYQQQQLQQQQGGWEQPKGLTGRRSNPNMQYGYQQGGKSPIHGPASGGGVPNVPPIPQHYLQQQQQPSRLQNPSFTPRQQGNAPLSQNQGPGPIPASSFPALDVPSLIAVKGYNPQNFDIRPQFARFFVIKSYTEDDVHKSLKYEIWSSTDPGNKRLDKAFKESSSRGPIYLFFSVNASGHFCGMAEMLTPVDYTRSSTVWASDKWKGVFKVRWIFVRDIPNVTLRHIKLNNTQERKPVTNSRDTQELLPDAGQEMLRLFFTHPARTSLLQDFAFYELQAMQKNQGSEGSSPTALSPNLSSAQLSQQTSPQLGHAAANFSPQQPQGMNPNALAYQMPQMSPMMQLQMQQQMLTPGGQFGIPPPQNQAMHQSVMRHPSPSPSQQGGQQYMGYRLQDNV